MMVFKGISEPLAVVNQRNGQLDVKLLKPAGYNEFLLGVTADWFFHLKAEFEAVNKRILNFTHGGCYRTYDGQLGLFLKRYVKVGWTTFAGAPAANRKVWPAIDKADPHYALNPTKTLWIKRGVLDAADRLHYPATAAVPGFSNHGLGMAIDLAIGLPSAPQSLTIPDRVWLENNIDRFGFTYESSSEPWHVTYYVADGCPTYMSESH